MEKKNQRAKIKNVKTGGIKSQIKEFWGRIIGQFKRQK